MLTKRVWRIAVLALIWLKFTTPISAQGAATAAQQSAPQTDRGRMAGRILNPVQQRGISPGVRDGRTGRLDMTTRRRRYHVMTTEPGPPGCPSS
jgi:hypothetical protein